MLKKLSIDLVKSATQKKKNILIDDVRRLLPS